MSRTLGNAVRAGRHTTRTHRSLDNYLHEQEIKRRIKEEQEKLRAAGE